MLKFERLEWSAMQMTPGSYNIVKLLAACCSSNTEYSLGLFQTDFKILVYSLIITLLNYCSKLLLVRPAKKGKSLKEVAALHC